MPDTALSTITSRYQKAAIRASEALSLDEYLEGCKKDHGFYANPWERLLNAIGEPEIVDTSKDEKLGRINQNQKIAVYPNLGKDFYGMEETIGRIVNFLRSAAQGLEEKNQILYLLGPVGGGKSSLATRLVSLMEKEPFYALAYQGPNGKLEISPFNDDPLALFDRNRDSEALKAEYNIDPRYLNASPPSPWLLKRLDEAEGDLSKFKIVKRYPSVVRQVAISRTEPADPNNQDVSALVGKVDIHKMDRFAQNDIDAYSPSGALCLGNRGVMEFVEMFKAPLPVLNPLLTATQEGRYNGTEPVGAFPWQGLIIAHSNESEWTQFKAEKRNEAFLDRVVLIKVPYTLRASEELKIYEKLLRKSELADKPVAPKTLEVLAKVSVLSRLKDHDNSSIISKMRVYDGENLKETDPNAKSVTEYREKAGTDEGMNGLSTRFGFKVLSKVFNENAAAGGEIAADPVRLMRVLDQSIKEEDLPKATQDRYRGFLAKMESDYREFIGSEIERAYLDSYHEYGQNVFDRYIAYADHWLDDRDYPDPQTGQVIDRVALNAELEKIEKPSGISNARDFRNELVKFALRNQTKEGRNPDWQSNEKMKRAIEKQVFAGMDKLLPIISFGAKANKEDEKKHHDFIDRMAQKGYTQQQVRTIVDWHIKGLKR